MDTATGIVECHSICAVAKIIEDGWVVAGEDVNNFVTEHANGAQFVSDASQILSLTQTILTIGKRYEWTVIISDYVSGTIQMRTTVPTVLETISANGVFTVEFIADATSIRLRRFSACDMVIASSSVKEFLSVDTIIDNLYKEAGKGRRLLVATMRDNTTQRQQYAKLVQAATKPDSRTYAIDSSGTECYEVVQCQFEIVYPYWELESDFDLFLDDGHILDDGLFLDAGNSDSATVSTTSTSKTITNNGNTAINKFQFTLVGLTGVTLTNVTLTNITTGETLTWTGTITENDILFIDSLAQTITFNGANAWVNTALSTNQVGFFTLELGANDFTIALTSISGGNATATWAWHTHYIR